MTERDSLHNMYEYRALETPTTIRILELQPDTNDGALVGRILHLDLLEEPEYDALSYVWGCPDPTEAITTSSGNVPIASNLAYALQQYRADHLGPLYIWADAVCIDQKNLDERGHQIKIMGLIYENAMEVFVWLGPDTHRLAQAISAIVRELNYKQNEPNCYYLYGLLPGLLQSDWFCRLWVVQEYCLARKAIFMWGSTLVSATVLSQFIGDLQPFVYSFENGSWFTEMTSLDHFLGAVQAARALSCSDDRDRIYGLLGLRYDPKLSITKALRSLEPDYSQSVEHLFMNIACLCLEHDQGTVLLSQVDGSPEDLSGLPTWIPDWRIPSQATPLADSKLLEKYSPLACSKALTVSVHRDSGTLIIQGIALSRVCSSMATLLDLEDKMATEKAIANYWSESLRSCREQHADPMDYAEAELAFACTFIDPSILDVVANTSQNLLFFFFTTSEATPRYRHLHLESTQTLKDMLLSIERSISVVKGKAGCHHLQILQQCPWTEIFWRGRRLFKTQDGFMGLGPGGIRASDELVLLSSHGRAVPAVLRHRGNHHILIGTAFIPRLWKYDQTFSSEDAIWDHKPCCSRGPGHHTGYDHVFFDRVGEATDYTLK